MEGADHFNWDGSTFIGAPSAASLRDEAKSVTKWMWWVTLWCTNPPVVLEGNPS